jgi:hypothetical protein
MNGTAAGAAGFKLKIVLLLCRSFNGIKLSLPG